MSPEQIQGRCDERSDVYGLGMTLYEMLTLTPPFADVNYLDAIQLICHEGPPPPREVDASIPRDLETIVLKAIARDPAERYASAADLGDDLKRFLEHKPIAAKRSGHITRAWRWVHRNQAAAISIGAVALLVGIFALGPSGRTDAEKAALQTRIAELEEELGNTQRRLKDAEDLLAERGLAHQ
jgi:serine/threonine protein kinase